MENDQPRHPQLTPRERRIVSEAVGRIGAQLMREKVSGDRWPEIVLALIVELADQVTRLRDDDERTDPALPMPIEAEP